MRWPDTLRSLRLLATPTIVRRGAIVASLTLLERLLTPVAAWALFDRPVATKIEVGLALALTYSLRTFAQRVMTARTEADLFDRITRSVLDGDVLRGSVLKDEDARAELVQGIYYSGQQLAQDLPAMVADAGAAVIVGIAVALVEPAHLVLAAASLTALAGAALAWSRVRSQKATGSAWTLQERVFERLVDALEGRLEIVASGHRVAFIREAGLRARAWGAAGVRVAVSSMLGGRLPLLAITAVVVIAIAAGSFGSGQLDVGLVDLGLFASVTPAFSGVAQGLQTMVRAERWVQVVAEVVRGAGRPARGAAPPPAMPRKIAFEGVSFRYDGAPTLALEEVTFAWNAERVLAVSGANGSGKSTLLRLLLDLAPPGAGRVMIGDVDLADLDADAWRAGIAFLAQRPYIPQRADVRSAIRLLAPAASDARILRALDRVGVLPALLRAASSAPLEVRVETLSVGQRQRVGLARMLCRDASLFLLDEPDANLDRAGIALVADIVRDLSRDRAVVLAAHTPELLELADRVLVLDGGRIARDERRPTSSTG